MVARKSIVVYSYLALIGVAGFVFIASDTYCNIRSESAGVRAYEHVLAYSAQRKMPAVAVTCYTAPDEKGLVECSYITLNASKVQVICKDEVFSLPFSPAPCYEVIQEFDNPYLR